MNNDEQLIDAAKVGDATAAHAALQSGADVNCTDGGFTPLMWAAQEGHAKVVEELLAARADLHYSDTDGLNALWQAVSWSHREIAEQLIRRGASVNHRNRSGDTILHIAAAYGKVPEIELLLRQGADKTAINDDGQSPYDLAITNKEDTAAELLQFRRELN